MREMGLQGAAQKEISLYQWQNETVFLILEKSVMISKPSKTNNINEHGRCFCIHKHYVYFFLGFALRGRMQSQISRSTYFYCDISVQNHMRVLDEADSANHCRKYYAYLPKIQHGNK